MPTRPSSIRRCAIYTRKSSEEGLEQAFNSLDAQREACEAYIASQRHEGWMALPTFYDDGGFSGGSMERPALRQLLADIEARRVDLVVVYKVDRLTRSLADFARIVDVFDRQGASFVSVTQQFNTTTSMGRLTLNMLLSFAQFEREVTGERIRDKIAASKRKGMWMGGIVPLGYAVQDRKLAVVENEAETVRHIFRAYLTLGSVRLLHGQLAAEGVTSKRRVGSDGRPLGGKVITRGNLYGMLANRLYRGEVAHKGACYPGEHPAIIDPALWDAVQAHLAANGSERKAGRGPRHPSLLAGLLFDEAGGRLVPTHASKAGRRYRYYVSHALITGEANTSARTDARATGRRLPAHEVEQLVLERLRQLLADGSALLGSVRHLHLPPGQQQRLVAHGAELARGWEQLAPERIRAVLRGSVARVALRVGGLALTLRPAGLVAVLLGEQATPTLFGTDGATATNTSAASGTAPDAASQAPDADHPVLPIAATLRRVGLEWRLVVDGPQVGPEPDAALIGLLRKAHGFREAVLRSDAGGLIALAAEAGVTRSYYTRVLRLAFLAPDIVSAILAGQQPVGLTAQRLLLDSRLPVAWAEQRAVLGFPVRS